MNKKINWLYLITIMVWFFFCSCSDSNPKKVTGYIEVIISPESVIMSVGDSLEIDVTGVYSPDDSTERDSILWTVSDITVAAVNSEGSVRALFAGETKVIATAWSSGMSDSADVFVTQYPADSMVIVPLSTFFIPLYDSAEFTVQIFEGSIYSTAEEFEPQWESRNEGVATMSNRGWCRAITLGWTEIVARTEKFTDTKEIEVIAGVKD